MRSEVSSNSLEEDIEDEDNIFDAVNNVTSVLKEEADDGITEV